MDFSNTTKYDNKKQGTFKRFLATRLIAIIGKFWNLNTLNE